MSKFNTREPCPTCGNPINGGASSQDETGFVPLSDREPVSAVVAVSMGRNDRRHPQDSSGPWRLARTDPEILRAAEGLFRAAKRAEAEEVAGALRARADREAREDVGFELRTAAYLIERGELL